MPENENDSMVAKDPPERDDVLKNLETAVSELITVTVATVITQVTVTFKGKGRLDKVEGLPDQATDALITNVNLIDGDLTTIIAPSLKDDADLRTFHDGLVQKAITILPENIKSLADAVGKVFGKRSTPAA
jgi:hypothetical protein